MYAGQLTKHDAPTGFMLAEKADGLAIGRDQVCKVKHLIAVSGMN